MYKKNKNLVGILSPTVISMGYELWGIEFLSQGRHSLIRLYIDIERGISLSDCEKVSHQVAGLLDIKDPINGPYTLEVSSPGLDRLLFTLDQFRLYKGKKVKLNLTSKLDGRKVYTGVIFDVRSDCIVILSEDKQVEIAADIIQQARIVTGLLDLKSVGTGSNKREN